MSNRHRGAVWCPIVVFVLVGLLCSAGVVAGQAAPPAGQNPAAPITTTLSRPTIVEQIIVKVNGEILTKTELEGRQVDALRQRGLQPKTEEELQKLVVEMLPEVLVGAVDEMLLVQRGRELGYKLTDERFKQILEGIRKQNKLESDEAFQAALKAENLTLSDLRQRFEMNLLRGQVEQQEVLARISITEEEARQYYADHAKEFSSSATVMLREILVSVPSDGKTINVGLDEEAKAKAEAARARAVKGEAFEKVVDEFSDAASKANGGLIGPLETGDLAPQLKETIGKLKVGEVSEILRTPRGYYFFKLDSSTEATVLPFEKVREEIGNRIGDSKRDAEFERYMRKLRDQAIIEWKAPDLKTLYEQHLAGAAASKSGL